ncbi:MAG: sodium/proton-translocating pyrophosphatase, partial [Candidatus Marinimicrobia bacterium]|nr:sodium/proton-translocating pyrophosphatase [Candidatus Neomarinimicrobiota bacterium]
MNSTLLLLPLTGIIALIYAAYKTRWINKLDAGNETMTTIAKNIQDGAMAFLSREYKVLAWFVLAVAILLFLGNKGSNRLVALSFILGAISSALAGYIGMRVATAANVRTTNAARKSLSEALNVAFTGGSVMGMSVVGLGIIGLSSLFMIYTKMMGSDAIALQTGVLPVISGFSLGASSIALFARVGGGIYTKAADIGADLVGKVEAGIPEDDPRNPAVIADNVGDNVGDVAGMGADLFESYVGSIVGAMVLGAVITANNVFDISFVTLPLYLASVGIIVSILATFFVRTKPGDNDPQKALNKGEFGAAGIMLILSYFIITRFLPSGTFILGDGLEYTSLGVFYATVSGLIAGVLIGMITEYYTAESKAPANSVAEACQTGAATNIIA